MNHYTNSKQLSQEKSSSAHKHIYAVHITTWPPHLTKKLY